MNGFSSGPARCYVAARGNDNKRICRRGNRRAAQQSGGELLRLALEAPVDEAFGASGQALIGEALGERPAAGAQGGGGQGPVDDVALGMAAADAPDLGPEGEQPRGAINASTSGTPTSP